MKNILILILIVSLCHCVTGQAHALYDPRSVPNNKAGVHILNPSELESATKLVGDWGYVIVPIQPTDRDVEKWESFFTHAKEKHVIPIIRITTIPQGGTWDKGTPTDLVDFANFLNGLPWPIENRYIVLFNEVNRSAEWGGAVEPARYADIVKNARSIFKERSEHFFLLGPALDDALPDSTSSMSAKKYLSAMYSHNPLIWTYFDGYAFHSYPNPGFVAPPTRTGLPSIVSYRYLFSQFKLGDKPVFITETGWDQTKLDDSKLRSYWSKAWEIWNKDPLVTAVTPFVLEGGEVFAPFSLVKDGKYTISGQVLFDLPKASSSPKPGLISPINSSNTAHLSENKNHNWKNNNALIKLENIFRVILGIPTKAAIKLGDLTLIVEQAETPKQWEKGLSSRSSLDGIDGMLFKFPRYHVPVFWMKDTLIPLDILWIKNGEIVEITPNVPIPTTDKLPTYSPQSSVDMVLELPAGFCETNNIQIGSTLQI